MGKGPEVAGVSEAGVAGATPTPGWALGGLALALAAALHAFSPCLDAGAVFDDRFIVARNPALSAPLERVARAPWWPDRPGSGLWRPVPLLSLALGRRWHGDDLAAAHGVNLALHLGAVALLYLLLRRLAPGRPALAAGAALLWACHPVHAEPVTQLVGRAELLATLATLGAVAAAAAWTGGGHPLWTAPAALLFAAGLLSKENAAAAPLLLVALHGAGAGRRGLGRLALATLGAALLVGGWFALRSAVLGPEGPLPRTVVFPGQGTVARAATALNVWHRYLGLAAWPRDLRPLYPVAAVPRANGLLDASVWRSAAVLGAVGVAALLLRRREPLALAGFLWWAFALLPVSHLLVPVGLTFAARCCYLPLMGLAAGVAALLDALAPRSWPTGARLLPALAVAVALSLAAHRECRAWCEELSLWSLAAARSGEAVPVEVAVPLGAALLDAWRPAEAALWLRRAEALAPRFANLQLDLARAEEALGQRGAAEARLRRARADGLDAPLVTANLAWLLQGQGPAAAAEAEALWREALALRREPEWMVNLARLLLARGAEDEARALTTEAVLAAR